jgi:isopenicillin-N N-acyltransferase-like protein
MTLSELPVRVIRMSGSDREAGLAYGRAAGAEIQVSLRRYAAVFADAGISSWETVRSRALAFREPIAEYAPGSLAQLEGIAAGAGLELADVLALNARSELMFGVPSAPVIEDGCTSVAIAPERAAGGHALLAQNWDWTEAAAESVVLLVREPDPATGTPGYISLVEAGLLAKTGVNSAGLGLCTNTLVSLFDDGAPEGVPYHVFLHQLLQVERVSDGLQLLFSTPRALSANYLLAHADGSLIDVETTSGGPEGVAWITADEGVLTHTNHFRDGRLARTDRRVRQSAHTILRLDRINRRLAAVGAKIDREDVLDGLRDHANFPLSVCLHGDVRKPEVQRTGTLATVCYDLETADAWIAVGNPCTSEVTGFSVTELLAGQA